jgi:hypothetical protein
MLHEAFEKWQDERWQDQKKINESLFVLCHDLSSSVNDLKDRISYMGGIMAAIIVMAPFLWKLIAHVLGVKL